MNIITIISILTIIFVIIDVFYYSISKYPRKNKLIYKILLGGGIWVYFKYKEKNQSAFRDIYYRIIIIWQASFWIRKVNITDRVWYEGKQYIVLNGVRSNQWNLITTGKNKLNYGWVDRSKCKKVKSLKNYFGSFYMGYRFYMRNWYDIWRLHGISKEHKSLPIWNKSKIIRLIRAKCASPASRAKRASNTSHTASGARFSKYSHKSQKRRNK